MDRRGRRGRRIGRELRVTLALTALGLFLLTFAAGAARLEHFPAPAVWAQDLGDDLAPAAVTVNPPAPVAAPLRVHPGADLQIDEFYVHIPAGAVEPLTPVLMLHGMGGAGREFSDVARSRCDGEHWIIVAPTFAYGDWRDPAVVTRESTTHFARINAFLDRLPDIAGMSIRPQVFVYGFSRGAQAANRYALTYPERVAGVAMMSAGTYTLPIASFGSGSDARATPFPFGVADIQQLFGRPFDSATFAQIPFWIGVGGRDNDPTDVPHQWDPYVGSNRVERAQRFAQWVEQAGASAELHVFPGVGHALPPEVNTSAMDFFAAHS
jgi:pimeloyl-ACP methyl ester carboxylesterase